MNSTTWQTAEGLPTAVAELSAALLRSNENLRDSHQLIIFLNEQLERAQAMAAAEKEEAAQLRHLLHESALKHTAEREVIR